MTKGVKITLAVVAALLGLSGLCCMGTLALGLVGDDSSSAGGESATTRGVSGAGFSFAPPSSFVSTGQGTWRREEPNDTERFWVNVARLPAISGREGPQQQLAALWDQAIVNAFDPLPVMERIQAPLLQRRFVSNGARAHFGRQRLFTRGTRDAVYVTIYLVEADDRLEPFLVVQGCASSSPGAAMICNLSFDKTHAWVEELMNGVTGSPTGAPLLSDDEVVGHYKFGSTSTAQWVNTITGATSMTAVVRAIDFTFADDHTYTYKFTGGSGQMGAVQVGSDEDRGTWKVEHDVLRLDGERHQSQYFITGAPLSPTGAQLLLLQPKPNWSLAPEAGNELYERQE